MMKRSLALVFALLVGISASARAADISEPVILVAKPGLRDSLYGASILAVTPLGGDQHIGFIVNRPTTTRLGTVFPEHGPSQKVIDPVYLGGPMGTQLIFAMVQRPDSPGAIRAARASWPGWSPGSAASCAPRSTRARGTCSSRTLHS